MFGLELELLILLFFCLLAACAFEFVNGFHDTANAVATVIYTNSLKPWTAVIWSGFCNFVGVFAGGIGVAMGIVNLLPVELLIDQNVYHSIAMVLALLFSAIAWNFGTWYYGLPSSSSHTLIGSILGVGLAFSFMPENDGGGAAVNWSKATEIGFSLLLSPIFGFSLAIFLMFALRRLVKDTDGEVIFKEPHKQKPPPLWIRSILLLTCTLVSFFHGSNDGQKGVGLVMLILIGIVPAYFALDNNINPDSIPRNLADIEQVVSRVDTSSLSVVERQRLRNTNSRIDSLQAIVAADGKKIPSEKKLEVRRDVLLISKEMNFLVNNESVAMSKNDAQLIKSSVDSLRTFTDYAPTWVIFMISISLGLGTMVGWKRIVRTVGEKIGKQHLTYAQGASAELVAASTIGVSTFLALPVSTTHVLSSGIAGSMVASKGIKNLQPKTIKNILMAWLLTLPVSITLSGLLYIFFRWVL
ncbi:inorganic phosphate transporter [Rhodocytophaga rosea]|uniref:Phosphate transporter n=1 Tax=Rhodocytophaga rosea TaxID=2704465 RepID=A0A6C0GDU0_9BACT|nr:inorganic phosphate transporter [Rhodocytophaga rosea]QHT65963.1 inorganic phosphate transporter [Rhodocytophaga rosea]